MHLAPLYGSSGGELKRRFHMHPKLARYFLLLVAILKISVTTQLLQEKSPTRTWQTFDRKKLTSNKSLAAATFLDKSASILQELKTSFPCSVAGRELLAPRLHSSRAPSIDAMKCRTVRVQRRPAPVPAEACIMPD
jgi:hypothetical protein